jgi:hypothetical protein
MIIIIILRLDLILAYEWMFISAPIHCKNIKSVVYRAIHSLILIMRKLSSTNEEIINHMIHPNTINVLLTWNEKKVFILVVDD